MKYVILAGALVFALFSGVCDIGAEDGECLSGSAVADQEADGEGGYEESVTHSDLVIDGKEPVDQIGVMSPGQTYDDNTGLPNVVESDSDMNLQ